MQNQNSNSFDGIKDEEFDDFDDFDLDGFEDDADLDSEWDEIGEEPAIQGSTMPPSRARSSLFSRYFNVIVIGLAVLVGGVFVVYKFGTPSPVNTLENSMGDPEVLENASGPAGLPDSDLAADLPPMPVPLDSASVDQQDNSEDLTPLPDLSGIEAESLPELDFAKAEKQMERMAAGRTMMDAPLGDDGEAMPEALPAPVLEPLPDMDAEEEDVSMAEAEPAPVLVPTPTPTPAPAVHDDVAEVEPESEVVVSPPPVLETVHQEAYATPEDLKTLDAKFTHMNEALVSKIDRTDKKLDDIAHILALLEDKIDQKVLSVQRDMEDQLKVQSDKQTQAIEKIAESSKAAEKAAQSVQAAASAPKKTAPPPLIPEEKPVLQPLVAEEPPAFVPVPEKPKTPEVKKAQASEPAPVKKASAPVKASTVWRMRSAQPGKAVVSPQGSSDMRNVEVGDTLDGIGKIQSIAMVSGCWVIEGTRGKILQ